MCHSLRFWGIWGFVVLAIFVTFAAFPADRTRFKDTLLSRDGNLVELPVSHTILCEGLDVNGAAVVSPLTSVGTTGTAGFYPPTGAISMTFRCSAAGRFGENVVLSGAATAKGYKVAPSGIDIRVPCSGGSPLYVKAEAGTIDIDFAYEILE